MFWQDKFAIYIFLYGSIKGKFKRTLLTIRLLFHSSILKSMEFRKSKTELKLNISTALETSCLLDTIQLVVLLGGKNKLSRQQFFKETC